MPRKKYAWSIDDPPEIAPHSLAKHRILREYVEEYIRVLTANPRTDCLRMTLVDGFAGGGIYRDPSSHVSHPGSPTILLDAVRTAEAAVNAMRSKPFRVDASYFLVDRDPSALACLREVLRRRPGWDTERESVHVLDGSFEDHLPNIIQSIRSRGRAGRSIFVLDQYGYTAAPADLLRRIFNTLPNAEVFLTVAIGWAATYLPDLRTAAAQLGIPQDFLSLVASHGEDGPRVDDMPTLFRLQVLLREVFATAAGSRYYTPFFIVSRKSNRAYWFLHMANNARANDVVKTLHWRVENHFEHFGGPGLAMLGYDPKRDHALIGQQRFGFDDPARERTRSALVSSLAGHFAAQNASGVRFDRLFEQLCNDTPATKAMLGTAVRELCVEGELEKTGGRGEKREPATFPKDDDDIRLARQPSLFRRRKS